MAPSGEMGSIMVSEKILALKKDTNEITSNPILDSISIDVIKYFEYNIANPLFQDKLKKIESYLNIPITISIDDHWKSLFNEYIEAYAFWYISRKVYIERVPEASQNRPDYKIKFENNDYYLEVKSPFYLNTDSNYRQDQEKGLEMQIDIEEQVYSGVSVAMGSQVHQPYNNGRSNYKPNSKRVIIEGIVNKVMQNFKAGQYTLGDTLLLVDLRQLGLSAKPNFSAMPVYNESAMGKQCICSGELWNAAFAQVGNPIYYFPMDYPYGNIEGKIRVEGILIQYPEIRAVIFQTESMNAEKCTLVGFARTDDCKMMKLLKVICEYYNDDSNSRRMYLEN